MDKVLGSAAGITRPGTWRQTGDRSVTEAWACSLAILQHCALVKRSHEDTCSSPVFVPATALQGPPGVGLALWKPPLYWIMVPLENSGPTQACKQVVLTWLVPYVGFKLISPFHCLVGGGSETRRAHVCVSRLSCF